MLFPQLGNIILREIFNFDREKLLTVAEVFAAIAAVTELFCLKVAH
jgi:hypothetical protein